MNECKERNKYKNITLSGNTVNVHNEARMTQAQIRQRQLKQSLEKKKRSDKFSYFSLFKIEYTTKKNSNYKHSYMYVQPPVFTVLRNNTKPA